METELSRIGISLPKNLLDRFDEIITARGYSSRSEGIRDAIRNYITYYRWMSDVKGERQGVITMIYDHDQRGLLPVLTDIQHEFREIVQATLHSHVTENRCLEVVLLHGDGTQLEGACREADVAEGRGVGQADHDRARGVRVLSPRPRSCCRDRAAIHPRGISPRARV